MIEQVLARIDRVQWFCRLGTTYCGAGLALQTLDFWKSLNSTTGDQELDSKLESMVWLPTSRDCEDPFTEGEITGAQTRLGLSAYRMALKGLRDFSSPLLRVGPHDFNEAAKLSGAYAARAFARSFGRSIMWDKIFGIYESGHWPLGISREQELIVF